MMTRQLSTSTSAMHTPSNHQRSGLGDTDKTRQFSRYGRAKLRDEHEDDEHEEDNQS